MNQNKSHTLLPIYIILTLLKAKQMNVCKGEKKKVHHLEICRITGKYEFLKNKAIYYQSSFCIYLKSGGKRKNKLNTFVRNICKMGPPL